MEAELSFEECVKCPECGYDRFDFVKEYSNDTLFTRELRCKKCQHTRVDTTRLPPAHVL